MNTHDVTQQWAVLCSKLLYSVRNQHYIQLYRTLSISSFSWFTPEWMFRSLSIVYLLHLLHTYIWSFDEAWTHLLWHDRVTIDGEWFKRRLTSDNINDPITFQHFHYALNSQHESEFLPYLWIECKTWRLI